MLATTTSAPPPGEAWPLAALRAWVRETARLVGRALAPRWAAAALSYLRDLDYYEQRQRVALGGRPVAPGRAETGASTATPKVTPKRKARPKKAASATG